MRVPPGNTAMAKKVTVSWTTANLHGETSFETRHHSVARFSRCSGVIRALFSRSILVAFFAALIVPLNNRAGSLPGQATFGFGGSEQEITESLDTLIPLGAPDNGLLFFNPKITTSDTQDARVSIGLGYRQLFEQPEIILGANVFYDNYATDNNRSHRTVRRRWRNADPLVRSARQFLSAGSKAV